MKFKFDIVFQPIGNFYLAVPVGAKAEGCMNYIKINNTCYLIADGIAKGYDQDRIIDDYQKEFGIEREIAARDVDYTIKSLRQMGFIED